ncbi:tetratricopeptide repeat protein [Saccharicrinis fermentans]|uniref:Photosystem I assembly protein Ycf3 n=1 Tax=Saccharicrinis fermentans DSM 9555 = JCM 21142 TaxID=869213 RepID=W7YH78_9BACT|nr:hypothetical protein [Saccharicrinis fermentans]GAF01949.1 photosystem I assembly protein Ycf3 [Saccharicrinis fermentans DSM 9555 = JCM 21142]
MKRVRNLMIPVLLFFLFHQAKAQDVSALYSSAKALVVAQDYNGALLKYKAAFETGEGDSAQVGEGYGYAGICYEEIGNIQEALEHYTKALKYKVLELSIYDKAIALAKTAKQNDLHEWMLLEKGKYFPEFEWDVERSLCTHYLRTKQYDKLLVSSDKLMQWFPDSPKYPYYKGLGFQSTGQIDSAEEVYKVALQKDPDYTSANMRLGQILFEKGNAVYAKKKKAYEAIAKPSRVDYSKYIKSLEGAKVIYREAETYLSKAYEKKQDPNLKKMLYAVYTRLGEKEKAQKYK